ncbi:MAG TPA: F0F1 ATP synthase subunit B' [Stellaceae bacterium]|jgi:F-type H+-transporting ATPase subunit b|nr:F0F1 ATP synthase subunit B' [Stellaceae bacterium]
MPQLDFSTYPTQLLWLAVTFVVLYLLMSTLALPRIGRVIAARRSSIDSDLSRAAALKSEAEAVNAAYENALAGARAQAQTEIKATTDRLAAEAAERQQRLGEELAQQLAAAERQIAAAKDSALAEIRGIAVEVAATLSAKLTGSPPEEARVAAAVEQVLAERAR